MPISEANIKAVNLPLRVFLYSLDQIGTMLDMDPVLMSKAMVHFEGRSIGRKPNWKMRAINIAGPEDDPEWRVADREYIRWLRNRGFRVVERGYVRE